MCDKTSCLISEVEELNNNTPSGVIRDADTILADLLQAADMEVTGIAQSLFDIWKNSSDKASVENVFSLLMDTEFDDYLEMCKKEISR